MISRITRRASQLLLSVKAGEISVHTSETVILEAVYVLKKQFGAPKGRIAAVLQEIVDYPSLIIPNRASVLAALAFWTQHGGLSFADCFHLALANHWGLERIYTFDRKMDRYPGVERIEP